LQPALSAIAEESHEAQEELRERKVFNVIKDFIDADIIAKRPAYSPYYDQLSEALLLLVVRLARRGMDKSTANVQNIEIICSSELGIILPLVQIMAEHMNSTGDLASSH
jgi:hypothetical protein